MSKKTKRSGIEWVGGVVSMPVRVAGEGAPFRPEVLFWMGPDGAVLGHTLGKPGELVELACENLRVTIKRPMYGRPHAPNRIRVASPELAEALRAGQSGIEVVCAPTPEIDAVFAEMCKQITVGAEADQPYLPPEIDPAAAAAFFRATAALFRAEPWKTVPNDRCLFSVTIEKLGVTGAALSVIGQMRESLGLVVFSGLDDFEAYLEAGDETELGEEPELPPHFALTFVRDDDLSATLRKKIAEHHWEVAGADAYPWPIAVAEDLATEPPTVDQITILEAIALALPEVLQEKKALLAAWDGGEPVARTLVVATHAGEVEVSLRAPFERDPSEYEPPYDVLGALFKLSQGDDPIDGWARRPLEAELVRRFAASPEGKALTDFEGCRFVMDLAADYLGQTIATLDQHDLSEILFELIPRKVSIDASAARWIIEQNRAFYTFLKRELGLKQAGACLAVLGGNAEGKLEAALSDPRKFGIAKSLVMRGREAGFDMSSKEGIEAWMRTQESQPLPVSFRLPSLGFGPRPVARPSSRQKKTARKAARKSRRKNR